MVSIKFKRTRVMSDVEWAITLGTWSNLYERLMSRSDIVEEYDNFSNSDGEVTDCPSDHIEDKVIVINSVMGYDTHLFSNMVESDKYEAHDGYVIKDEVLSYDYVSDKVSLSTITFALLVLTLADKLPGLVEVDDVVVNTEGSIVDFDDLRQEICNGI